MKQMKRWAWRLLPHEYRFGLFCVCLKPRHDPERIAWAKLLRDLRQPS